MSSTDSCGSPLRNELDSIPSPVTAPPSVIVFSCGTTSGISPYASVASTRSSYVVMPSTSAVRASGATERTPASPETSSPGVAARARKTLLVRFASRTEPPGGTPATWARIRSAASS